MPLLIPLLMPATTPVSIRGGSVPTPRNARTEEGFLRA
jgi:hypothetical protein